MVRNILDKLFILYQSYFLLRNNNDTKKLIQINLLLVSAQGTTRTLGKMKLNDTWQKVDTHQNGTHQNNTLQSDTHQNNIQHLEK